MRSPRPSGVSVGFDPCVVRSRGADGCELIRVGHPLLDDYLELVAARARWNTVLATAFDLKVLFCVVDTDPADVTTSDVLGFIKAQRAPRRGSKVVRIEDGEAGLSARTIKRRLATIAGLYEYLIIRGDCGVSRNPVPRGLAVRRPGQRPVRGVPLIRAPRTLPRVIDPDEVDVFIAALRTHRDRAWGGRRVPRPGRWSTPPSTGYSTFLAPTTRPSTISCPMPSTSLTVPTGRARQLQGRRMPTEPDPRGSCVFGSKRGVTLGVQRERHRGSQNQGC